MVLRAHPLARYGTTGLCVLAAAWPLAEAADDPRSFVLLLVASVAPLEAARRIWRLRADVGREGVTVVNFWRTRRVPWARIDRFVVTDKGLRLVLRSGGQLPVTAFMASSRELNAITEHRDAALRSLEAYRRRR